MKREKIYNILVTVLFKHESLDYLIKEEFLSNFAITRIIIQKNILVRKKQEEAL